MSEKAFVREAKRFAQKRLEEEYGFAPGSDKIIVMAEEHVRLLGRIVVGYAEIIVNGKGYAISNSRVEQMKEAGGEEWWKESQSSRLRKRLGARKSTCGGR